MCSATSRKCLLAVFGILLTFVFDVSIYVWGCTRRYYEFTVQLIIGRSRDATQYEKITTRTSLIVIVSNSYNYHVTSGNPVRGYTTTICKTDIILYYIYVTRYIKHYDFRNNRIRVYKRHNNILLNDRDIIFFFFFFQTAEPRKGNVITIIIIITDGLYSSRSFIFIYLFYIYYTWYTHGYYNNIVRCLGPRFVNTLSEAEQNVGETCLAWFPFNCDANYKYRKMNGECTNLDVPSRGKSVTACSRLLPALYKDGKRTSYIYIFLIFSIYTAVTKITRYIFEFLNLF